MWFQNITFCVFLNKLNNSDQCDSSVDCLAHFSMRGNYSSLHPYQTDLWYVFLLFIFFTVVYSLNPSDLFGSLGVNHWTAWWGNNQRPTWNLITKKKDWKKYLPMILDSSDLKYCECGEPFFCHTDACFAVFFLRFFHGFCWLWLRRQKSNFFKLDLRSSQIPLRFTKRKKMPLEV